MTCFTSGLIRPDENLIDNWGGSIYFIATGYGLGSVLITIQTPWGEVDDWIEVDLNQTKTYTSGGKTYTVKPVLIADAGGEVYVAKFEICYVFEEKLNTECTLSLDEGRSSLVEGGDLYLNMDLKDQNGTGLPYQIKIYRNGIYVWQINPPWPYEYLVTPEDVGETLVFQTKFEGNDGFNPSVSPLVSVVIPGKIGTSLSIGVDRTTVNVDKTVKFTGILKDENGNPIPNMGTLSLVYKMPNGVYEFVLGADGYKIIASTDENGNYYRPWEPTPEFADDTLFAMFFEGDVTYQSSRSPDVELKIISCPIPTITGIKTE